MWKLSFLLLTSRQIHKHNFSCRDGDCHENNVADFFSNISATNTQKCFTIAVISIFLFVKSIAF